LLAVILVTSYIAFAHFLVALPVVAALVSFATAAPLALLRRSLNASTVLDERIFELTEANELLPVFGPELVATNNFTANPAGLIARLTGANAVAIYVSRNGKGGQYRLAASYGAGNSPSVAEDELQDSFLQSAPHSSITNDRLPPPAEFSGNKLTAGPAQSDGNKLSPLKLRLGWRADSSGALLIGPLSGRELDNDTLRLCAEIAVSYLARIENEASSRQTSSPSQWRRYFPRGIEWKTRALGHLNQRLLARARFVDRALRSAEEGLIVADISGCIAFANPRAAEILGIPERGLIGSDLFWRMRDLKDRSADTNREVDRIAREVLISLVTERGHFESEFQVNDTPPRYCIMRLSAVTSGEDGTGQILGLVATLSDVTQQREFEGMKTDVMTLVTHELRTPLTAIQGMSEVLAQFEVDSERRHEMHLAINEEAKRLSHMINEYLDITRLESGARRLRLAPVGIGSLIERVLLLLDPVAAQRQIRVVRRLASNLPGLLADADLIAQALTNLIANAIKYSPLDTEIIVEGHTEGDTLVIEVTDHGYGIPTSSLSRIFEKFYRVPRVEDADVPGTGLGLSLVREIVELHGGRIAVESEIEVGSTFSVYLPLVRKEN
jgi:two-component system phosphate regulon sensor histidine kinase PhoR